MEQPKFTCNGNPHATSESNATNTLLIYEDWSSGTLDGWTLRTSAAGYTATIDSAEGNPPPSVEIYGDNYAADYNQFIYKNITKPVGIGLRIITDHAGYHGYYTTNVYTRYFIYATNGTEIAFYDYYGDANNVWIYNDQWLVTDSSVVSLSKLMIGFGLKDAWDVNWNQKARFDNIRIMLYTTPEPTVTLGNEESIISTSNNQILISKNNTFTIYLNPNATLAFASVGSSTLSAPLSSGWNQIAFSYDGSQQNLYVDGNLVNSTTAKESIGKNSNPLLIGKYFNGTIDEIRLYNRILDKKQIEKLYSDAENNAFNVSFTMMYTGINAPSIGKDFLAHVVLSNGTVIDKSFQLSKPLGMENPIAYVSLQIKGYYPSYGLINKLVVCSKSCSEICYTLDGPAEC